MRDKKFLITGHPRSGTGFMSRLMKEYGYNVGHERMKSDGISSWMFTVNEDQVFGDRGINRKDFNFNYLIMTIRNPLDIISSTHFTENNIRNLPNRGRSFAFRKKHVDFTGLNQIEIAVKSVLDWYRYIERQRPHLILHIDKNPEDKLFHFLKRHENLPLQRPIPKITFKVNSRKHDRIDFETIQKECSEALVEELKNFCALYGYEI